MRTLIGLVVLVLFISFAFGEDGEQQEEVRFETASAINARKQYKTAILQAEAKFKKDIIKAQTAYIKNLDTTMKAVMRSGNLEEANKLSAEKKHIEELLETFKTEQVELQDKKIALMGIRKHPKDAVKFGNHYYQIIEERVLWEEAKKKCQQLKGHLVCIETKAENEFIKSITGKRHLWLGASDAEKEGTWKWVNGKPFKYTAWDSGQPNSVSDDDDYLITDSKGAGRWHDTPQRTKWMFGYICEWDK